MSTSAELMYAILAMDAYNRGYNPGMVLTGVLTGSQIGSATISTDSTEEFRVPGSDPEDPTPEQDAGFYAVAYEWNGETIISYRRTDSKGELLGTDYPIAVNDDYDEVRVFPSKRVPHAGVSPDGKYGFDEEG